VYLAITAAITVFSIQLQTRGGPLSLWIVFALAGFAQLSLPQAYLLSLVAAVLPLVKQDFRTIRTTHVAFHMAVAVLSLKVGYLSFLQLVAFLPSHAASASVIFSCPSVIGVSSFLLAARESAEKRVRLLSIWPRDYAWSTLYYVGCAAAAALLVELSVLPLKESLLILLPLLLLGRRALNDQRRALDLKRQEANEFTGLQLGVLQVLALALEAREGRGVIHFERLARYARGLGRAMGLEGSHLMALETGALLHDVGKLAVPDYLLSKPGSLTPEEFELLKQHPVVGAEIIEKANLPYAVAPLVRAHHENWDGTGYPDAKRGEEIPVGARILRALDVLDALTADRSYRRGHSLVEAIAQIKTGAGTQFDPQVVHILQANYEEWEQELISRDSSQVGSPDAEPRSVTKAIAEARREEKILSELINLFKASLDLEGTMIRLEKELGRIIPHETMVLYRLEDDALQSWHVSGENYRMFESIAIPLGRGVSGLVARTGRGVADGMAAADLTFTAGEGAGCRLRSMLCVPLGGAGSISGVLSLYADKEGHFTADHLRLLAALAPSLTSWLGTSLLYHQAENRASTDALTGLPNAASLFSHMQNEIARASRSHITFSVVVCDLDGFKAVNDRFGHLVGNDLLKAIAAGLKAHCREYDFVARMGGDEFVLVLPGVDIEAARGRCQRLETVVIAAGFEVCGEECVHMSTGIAQLGVDGKSPDELVAAADLRMYEQKQSRKSSMLAKPR
jgi:diguanylate cyclase (GGDEF)-like protein/putative nucleotidyltransferase with HDIG domain